MHRRVLEIRREVETEEVKRDEPPFHFSEENDGYYWLFYYFNNGKPYNRRIAVNRNATWRTEDRIAARGVVR